MVKEAAEAGFNVFSPRKGYEDLDAVRQVTAWCRKYGMYHQVWMRGVQDVPKDLALSAGKRVVWADGSEQLLWSPNSDELYQWLASYVIPYAQIGATDDTLMGVFLDYENYWPGGRGNLYELSYDDVIMGKFAAAKGLELPALELKDRKAWLEGKKLHEEFAAFQIAHWRAKCRELRQAVDKINPKFQFNIYPAPGTMYMLEACYPEWATKAAPLILADPWTYGRPGRYTGHAKALEANREIIERGKKLAESKYSPSGDYIYLGGIDPVVNGADPEFSGKNALLVSGLTGGYWIFYEGPVYAKDHPDYFHWFRWAHQQMDANNYAAASQPRETEDPFGFPKLQVTGSVADRQGPRQYPPVMLRGSGIVLVAGRKGVPTRVTVQVTRIGKNEQPLNWTAKNAAWADLAQGTVPVATKGTISFTPDVDGVFPVLLEAGGNATAVTESDTPVAILAAGGARFIYGAEKLYFTVPAGLQSFTLKATGQGVECIKVTVFDPAGNKAGEDETTPTKGSLELKVSVGDQGGKVWSLTTGKAATGAFEDNTLVLDPALSPVLSYFADEVFAVKMK